MRCRLSGAKPVNPGSGRVCQLTLAYRLKSISSRRVCTVRPLCQELAPGSTAGSGISAGRHGGQPGAGGTSRRCSQKTTAFLDRSSRSDGSYDPAVDSLEVRPAGQMLADGAGCRPSANSSTILAQNAGHRLSQPRRRRHQPEPHLAPRPGAGLTTGDLRF